MYLRTKHTDYPRMVGGATRGRSASLPAESSGNTGSGAVRWSPKDALSMWQSLPEFGTGVLYAVLVAAAYTLGVAVVAGVTKRPRFLQAARAIDEVGRLVLRMAAVDAADATRGEKANPGHGRRSHGRRHRGRTNLPAHQRRTQVARADLGRARCDALEVGIGQADAKPTVEHRHRGRHRTLLPDRGLALARGAQVVRGRQPLAHDRGLESDHRPTRRQRLGDLGRDLQQVGQPGRAPVWVTAPEATSTAC